MEKRRIGKLEVSVVGLGCNQIGTTIDEKRSANVVAAALDHGVNFFDTADEYGGGRSEEYLGKALRGKRDKVIIATKFGSHHIATAAPELTPLPPGEGGASARWIEIVVERSLRWLGTDYIDLYQLHFPDDTVPVDETLTALDRLIRDGKVREIGCANYNVAQIDAAVTAAQEKKLHPFVSVQNRMSLLRQEALADVIPACTRHGMSFLPFFPLASGILTGKYRRGEMPEADSRLGRSVAPEAIGKILSDKTLTKVESLETFAKQRGHSVLDLAFAWLLAQPAVASVIAGATRPEQIAANVKAAAWKLGADEAKEAGRLAA